MQPDFIRASQTNSHWYYVRSTLGHHAEIWEFQYARYPDGAWEGDPILDTNRFCCWMPIAEAMKWTEVPKEKYCFSVPLRDDRGQLARYLSAKEAGIFGDAA